MFLMKDTSKENSSHRINHLLSINKWSQSDLARLVSVSPQAVQQWVKGTSAPRGKSLAKLSNVTGLPEHWFFMAPGEEDNSAPITQGRVLDARQEKLLSLFDQMPESEKDHMISLFEEKVKGFEKLLHELIALKNKKI